MMRRDKRTEDKEGEKPQKQEVVGKEKVVRKGQLEEGEKRGKVETVRTNKKKTTKRRKGSCSRIRRRKVV
jgi:hypothetical protein